MWGIFSNGHVQTLQALSEDVHNLRRDFTNIRVLQQTHR